MSFVEDLEQYDKLPSDQQKKSKVRVTFFGSEAETLVDLRVAQVVEAEKDMHVTSYCVCVCLCVCVCVCVCLCVCVCVFCAVFVSLCVCFLLCCAVSLTSFGFLCLS